MGDTILLEREHQIWSLKVDIRKNAEFEHEMILLEEKVDRDREFTYVLNKQELRFLHKSTL